MAKKLTNGAKLIEKLERNKRRILGWCCLFLLVLSGIQVIGYWRAINSYEDVFANAMMAELWGIDVFELYTQFVYVGFIVFWILAVIQRGGMFIKYALIGLSIVGILFFRLQLNPSYGTDFGFDISAWLNSIALIVNALLAFVYMDSSNK